MTLLSIYSINLLLICSKETGKPRVLLCSPAQDGGGCSAVLLSVNALPGGPLGGSILLQRRRRSLESDLSIFSGTEQRSSLLCRGLRGSPGQSLAGEGRRAQCDG